MSRPQLSIGFIKKRKAARLQEFKDGLEVGMLADDVVALAYNKLVRQTRRPKKVAEGEMGYIIEWYYPGVVLTLERKTSPGAYRISKIELSEEMKS